MNMKFILRIFLSAGLLLAAAGMQAQTKLALGSDDANFPAVDPDSVNAVETPIIEYLDSATYNEIMLDMARRDSLENIKDRPVEYSIFLLDRAYDDRVALRWAPSEYVPWYVLNSAGYHVIRVSEIDGWFEADTLALVKPWPLEKFKQHFNREDSIAGVAAQLVWGGAEIRLDQAPSYPYSPNAIMEVYDEQQSVVGMAMMVAEMRPDLAEAMGLMYIDRTAKKDVEYSYVVAPNISDTTMFIRSDATFGTKLGTWKPQVFDKMILDSLQPPKTAMLYWEQGDYFAYDIERQDKPGGAWKKLNERPYVSLTAEGEGQLPDNGLNMFRDQLDNEGVYSYRISGYDAFGDKSLPSEPYEVTVPDMVPPVPPSLRRIVVDHPDKEHAYATIYFHVDTIEADLEGYLPLYRHGRIQNGEWHPLTMDFTAPGDTVMKVDVSGLPTGQLSIAAYDKAGNQGASVAQMILLEDYLPPSAPTNLRANVFPDGYLELRWTPSPEPDVAFYEVWFANDSTHVFMNLTNDQLTDTLFVDSLALGLNQPYIYYKVRAVDYSGNSSEDSKMLSVPRPNFIPPSVCRADSVWMTDDDINIWWIQSNEQDLDYHRLFRKMEGDELWELMGVYKADSLRQQGDLIRFKDSPKPNMRRRYIYAVETYNLTGVTSGLSLMQTFLFRGPSVIDIKLKLSGDYTGKNNETRLAWETGKVPDYGDWHYCVYRKGPQDSDFQFLMATQPNEPMFNDFLIRPGETAEYYVTIRYDDGRRSNPSNIVKVSAPQRSANE
jgi:hypothetical protein